MMCLIAIMTHSSYACASRRTPSIEDYKAASDALMQRWSVTLSMNREKGEAPMRVQDPSYTRPPYVPRRGTVFGNVLKLNVGKDVHGQGMFQMFRDELVLHLTDLFDMKRDADGRWVIELAEFAVLPFVTVVSLQDGKPALAGLKWLLQLLRESPKEYFVYVKCTWVHGHPVHAVPLVRLGLAYWHFDRNMSQYIGRAFAETHLNYLYVDDCPIAMHRDCTAVLCCFVLCLLRVKVTTCTHPPH